MREIVLTDGSVSLVDEEDYYIQSQFVWSCMHSKSGNLYAVRRVNKNNRTVYIHRSIMGDIPELDVDHVDGNGLNNQRYNLRWSTRAQNQGNKRVVGGTSSYRGVWWEKGKQRWRAGITIKGRGTSLGQYVIEEEAARAYDAAAKEHFGEFARLNFP